MHKDFETIADFIEVRKTCVFCQGPLRPALTNFLGINSRGFPVLDFPIQDGKIIFDFKHATASYYVETGGLIDIRSNQLLFYDPNIKAEALVFCVKKDDQPTTLYELATKNAFEDLRPHIEISCTSKSCKMGYSLCSLPFTLVRSSTHWNIPRTKLFLETFNTKHINVENDWISNITNIYSRTNPDVPPIQIPMLDFQNMGVDKLLNKVRTLVVFS